VHHAVVAEGGTAMNVELVEITKDNLEAVYDLKVAEGQEEFVASNAWSLAQAYAERDIAWARAVVAGDEVVGFLMLEIDPHEENGRHHWLWRLMIDAAQQRKGYGRSALGLALDELRHRGATEVYTSWVVGDGGPEPFYLGLGFEPTGELDDDEVVARLVL
jgi:diamine N-acetyltransferase